MRLSTAILFSFRRVHVFVALCLLFLLPVCALSAPPAPYPFDVNSQSRVAQTLEAFKGSTRTYRGSFYDGTNVMDLTGSTLTMSWATNQYAGGSITSVVSVYSTTNGLCDFTFTAAMLNYDYQTNIYEVSVTDSNGSLAVVNQGVFLIRPSVYATGTNIVPFSTNVNLVGQTFLNAPWIESIVIVSGTTWGITSGGATRTLTVNTNSGYDGGITNNVSNTTGLTFTNSGRQSYAAIGADTITAGMLIDGAISNAEIAANAAIAATKIANTSLTQATTFAGDVAGTWAALQIQSGVITNDDIASNAAIAATKIAGTALIQSTVHTGDVAGVYSNLQLQVGVVGTSEILDGSITNDDINANAAISATKIVNTGLTQATSFAGDIAGTWAALNIVSGSVGTIEIADGAVSNDDINANANIAASKISGTAATTAQLYSAVLNDAQYINALLRDGSRSFTSNQNAGGFSVTNAVRFAGTNGAINMSTRAADSTTVWTDLNADLLDGFDSTVLRTNAAIQGQTGFLSSSNANRQIYLTLTGVVSQVDFAAVTNGTLTNVMLRTNNGSDIPNTTTFRSNLGLGTAATNAYTSSVFNASQLMDFSVSGTDPSANQIFQLSSSVWTPYSVGGDATLVTGNLQIAAAAITITEVDTNSLDTVFATDIELNNASNALRTTANILATQQWTIAQYPNAVLRDGSRSMTGNLNMAQNNITNVQAIGYFGDSEYGFNFEENSSLSTNIWTSLNADMVDDWHGSNLVKNTGSQRMTGPLVVTDSVLIHTNLHLAATNSLGSELLVNGTFSTTNADGTVQGWSLASASYDAGAKIYVAPGATATITYTNPTPITAYKSYQVSFLADIDTGTNPTTFRVTLGGYTQTYANIYDATFPFQARLENTNNLVFSITPGTNTIFLDTVSVKEITQGDAWFSDDVTVGGALRVAENAVFASNVTAASFTGVFGGSSTSFVEIAGDTMLGAFTNNVGYYGNGVGITNLPAGSSSAFVLKTGDTMTGRLTMNSNIVMNDDGSTVGKSEDIWFGAYNIGLGYSYTGRLFSLDQSGLGDLPLLKWGWPTGTVASAATIWHSQNDGASSTLDADLLDGLSSAAFITNNIILSNSTVVGSASKFNFVNPSTLTIAGGTANVTTATSGSGVTWTNVEPVIEWYSVQDSTTNNNMDITSRPANDYLSTYTATTAEQCIMFWLTSSTTPQDRQRGFSFMVPLSFNTGMTNIQLKMRSNSSTNGNFVVTFFNNNQSVAFTNTLIAANTTETKNMPTTGTLLTNLTEGLKLQGRITGTYQTTNALNQGQMGIMGFKLQK